MKVPTSTRNSLTKVLSPGSDRVASATTRKTPAIIGATEPTPPYSAASRVRRRSIRKPTTKNKAPVDSPWLTMYSTLPAWPWLVRAKTPMPMKPKCATEV